MKRFLLWSMAVLIAVCGNTGITLAQSNDVVTNLEIPAQDQSVAGLGVIAGWAFVRGNKDVQVRLRIDGVTRSQKIACCTARQDVDNAVPGAPDNTGFSFLANFANLTPGPHLIGIDARSNDAFDDFFGDRERTVIDHNVIVIKPGNTDILNSLNLNGASCSIANNEITVNNAQLTSNQGTSTANLTLGYETSSQTFVVQDSSDAPVVKQFVAHLNGSQETPLVKTSATGEASLTLNTDNSLTCNVTTNNLDNATVAHIHLAPAGVAGPIIITLNGGPTTWSCPATVLTAAQLDALRIGHLYVNVHTTNRPDGQIRGQIVAPSPA